jgi:hypothetical protein
MEVGAGCDVGGIEVKPLGKVGFDSLDRGVEDWKGVRVGVGVRVSVGVGVGKVEVGEGMSEAVAVGTVAVGKGPRRAPAVMARAVFVLFALRCESALPRMGLPRTTA